MSAYLDDVAVGLVVRVGTLRTVLASTNGGGKQWWIASDPSDARETTSITIGHGHPDCWDPLNTLRYVVPALHSEIPAAGVDNLVVIFHPSTLFSLDAGIYMDRCPPRSDTAQDFRDFYGPIREALTTLLIKS